MATKALPTTSNLEIAAYLIRVPAGVIGFAGGHKLTTVLLERIG
jgi:hypothetical protein